MLRAVEMALKAGVPTRTHVLNLLHRLTGTAPSLPEVTPPEALALTKEPKADVGRYDGLRGREQASRNAS